MPNLSKEEFEWFQKKKKQEKKQRLYDTMVRIRQELWVKAAKAAKVPEPTDDEVTAEINRRVKAGTMKPFK